MCQQFNSVRRQQGRPLPGSAFSSNASLGILEIMKILVVGGAGYIGSHVAREFLDSGHAVTVFDNLSTGTRENLFREEGFTEGDIHDYPAILAAMRGQDAVIHLAAAKAAGESMLKPEKYSVPEPLRLGEYHQRGGRGGRGEDRLLFLGRDLWGARVPSHRREASDLPPKTTTDSPSSRSRGSSAGTTS